MLKKFQHDRDILTFRDLITDYEVAGTMDNELVTVHRLTFVVIRRT